VGAETVEMAQVRPDDWRRRLGRAEHRSGASHLAVSSHHVIEVWDIADRPSSEVVLNALVGQAGGAQPVDDAGHRWLVEVLLRHDIWIKLMGNIAFNPLSALTRATMAGMRARARSSRR
jgi:ketopantoate reductase